MGYNRLHISTSTLRICLAPLVLAAAAAAAVAAAATAAPSVRFAGKYDVGSCDRGQLCHCQLHVCIPPARQSGLWLIRWLRSTQGRRSRAVPSPSKATRMCLWAQFPVSAWSRNLGGPGGKSPHTRCCSPPAPGRWCGLFLHGRCSQKTRGLWGRSLLNPVKLNLGLMQLDFLGRERRLP